MLHSNERIIKHKVGLLNLAEELGNVSKACQVMGLSRDTFYRYKAAVDEGGIEGLLDKDRRRPNLKNRTDERTEAAVLEYALEQPAHGQVRTSNELRKRGFFISPSGVRGVWLRHVRVPAHDGHDSGGMADTVPGAWRTVFRGDDGHFPRLSGMVSAMRPERCPR